MRIRFGLFFVAIALSVGVAKGATLTWDSDGGTAGAQDGGGTWDLTSANWLSEAGSTNWNNVTPDNAVIGAGQGSAGTISLATNITTGGITFNAPAGYVLTNGTLTLSGSPTVTANADAQIASSVVGVGLTKAGESTLTLAGSGISYTGNTAVSVGTLRFADAINFQRGTNTATALTIAAGATNAFVVSTNTGFYVDTGHQAIGTTGGLTVSGAGAFVKTGPGVLAMGGNGASGFIINMGLSPGALIDVQGGTLRNGGWAGAFWAGTNWTNQASINIASGATFSLWDGNTVYADTLTGDGTLTGNAGKILNVGTANGSSTFSGTGANVTVAQIGSGTFTLSGSTDNASLAGTVNTGVLVLAKASTSGVHAIGNGLTVNGGIAQLAGSGGDQIYDGSWVTVNGGLLDLNGQSDTIKYLNGSGGMIANGVTGTPSVLTFSSANSSGSYAGTIGSNIQVVVVNSTTKNTYVQAFSGTNTYTGGTVISNGHLRVTSDAALGALPGAFDPSNVVIMAGGVLQNNDSSPVLHANRGIYLGAGGGILYAGWSGNNRIMTINGVISGPGGLTKTDGAPLILTATNTYSGDTLVNQAVLRLGAANTIPDGAGKGNVTVSGTLDLNSFSETINGLNGGGLIETQVAGTPLLTVGNGDAGGSYSGTLRSGSGVVSLAKVGAGTQTFAGTVFDHSGSTTVSGGRLVLRDLDDWWTSGIAIGSGCVAELNTTARAMRVNTATTMTGTGTFVKSGTQSFTTGYSAGYTRWNMSGGLIDVQEGTLINDYCDQTVAWVNNKASLSVSNGATVSMVGGNIITVDALGGLGTVQNINSWGVGVFTVGVNGGSGSFGGLLRDNGGVVALVKSGTGTQELSGANAYSGGTTVNGGTLKASNASGSATGSGAVTLNAATLSGTGIIAGSVNNISGRIAPGASVGTLTVGSLTMAPGTTYDFEFNATPANDTIVVTNSGGLTINGGGFNLFQEGTRAGWTTPGTYNLMQFTGALAGTGVSALSVINPQAGMSYAFGTSGSWVTLTSAADGAIWSGAGGNASWQTDANWSGGSRPAASNVLTFGAAGALQVVNNNDYAANTRFGGIVFANDGVFTLNGNAVNLLGNVANNTTNGQTINLPLVLDGGSRYFNTAAGGMTIGGPISDGGAALGLFKSGAGTLTLTATNTFTGGSVVSEGTLLLGGAGLLGSGGTHGGAIVNSGVLQFGSTAAQTLNGVISGTGTVVKTGGSYLYLGAANTYTGPTLISGGVVRQNVGTTFSGSTAMTISNAVLEIRYGSYSVNWLDVGSLTLAGGATLRAAPQYQADNGDIGFSDNILVIGTNTLYAIGGSYGKHNWLSGGLTGDTNAYMYLSNGAGYGVYADRRAIILSGGVWSNYLGVVNAANDVTINGAIDLRNARVIVGNSLGFYANGAVAELGELTGAGTLEANGKTGGEWKIGNLGTSTTYPGIINGASKLTKVGAGSLTLTGANTYTGATVVAAGTLAIGGAGILGGGAYGAPVTNNATLVMGSSANQAMSGGITGSGSVVKLGAGTLTLAGQNSYAGATAVSNGMLLVNGSLTGGSGVQVGAGASLGGAGSVGGEVAMAAGSFLQPGGVGAAGTLTISNLTQSSTTTNWFDLGDTATIGGGVNDLVDVGSTLSPNSAVIAIRRLRSEYTNGSYRLFNYGTLNGVFNTNVQGNLTRQISALDISTPHQVNLTVAGARQSLTWLPVVDGNWDMGTSNWFSTATDRYYDDDIVTFGDGGAALASTVNLATVLAPYSVTVNSASNYAFTGSGRITGASGLVKSGAGTLTVSTANDFTGGVSVTGGTLSLGNALALGQTNNTLTLGGGALDLNGTNATVGVFTGTGMVTNGAATAGSLTAGQANSSWTFGGVMAGNMSLTKTGTGTLLLATNSTFVGSTYIQQGLLQLGVPNALPTNNLLHIGRGTANGTTRLVLNGFNQTIGQLFYDNNIADIINGAATKATLTIAMTANVTQGMYIGDSANAETHLNNNFDLVITGGYFYNGSDTYYGGTTYVVGLGTVYQIRTGYPLGRNPLTLVANRGVLDGGELCTDASDRTVLNNQGITLAGGGGYLRAANNRVLTIAAPIAGAGALGVVPDANYIVLNNKANSWSGGLSIGATNAPYYASGNARLYLGAGEVIPNGAGKGDVLVTNIVGSSLLNLNGYSETLNGLWGNGTVQSTSGAPTLTVGDNNASSVFAGAIQNAIGLTKTGSGVLTLNGANTYTGSTMINGGTLALGSAGALGSSANILLRSGTVFDVSAKSGYTVSGGQTLGGSGTVTGAVTLAASSRLSPGGNLAAGTLAFQNDVTLNAASTNVFDLTTATVAGSGTNDLVTVAGNLTPNGSTIAVVPLAPLGLGSYQLFTYGGALVNEFNTNVVNTTRNTWVLDTNTPGQVRLTVSATNSSALVWQPGVVNAQWDLGTTNWLAGAAAERFFDGDGVTFGDAGAYSNSVALVGTLYPAAVTVNSASNYTFGGAGAIGGGGSLTKLGAGTLVLAGGNNSYAGATVVGGGTLQVGAGGTVGSLAGDIVNNALLVFSRSDALTYGGVISGTGVVWQSGTGSLTLSGDRSNTMTGTTVVSAGTTYLNKIGAYALAGTAQIGGGNTLQPYLRMLWHNQFAPGAVMVSSNTYNNWVRFDLLGTDQSLAGVQDLLGGLVIQNGGIGVGSAVDATLTVTNDADWTVLSHVRDYDNVNSGGRLCIVKSGVGNLLFGPVPNNGARVSYTGPTTIQQGTLTLYNETSFNSDVSIAGGASLVITNSTVNSWNYNRNITGTGTWVVWGPGVQTQGDLRLAGNNQGFTGTLIITNGTRFGIGTDTALPSTAVNITPGNQLWIMNAGTYQSRPVTLSGNGWYEADYYGALRFSSGGTFAAPITLAGDTRVSAWGSTGMISGSISGPYNLDTYNNNSLYLTGSNSFQNLRFYSNWNYLNGSAAAGRGTLIFSGGGLSAYGGAVTFTNPVLATTTVHTGYGEGGQPMLFTGPWDLGGDARDFNVYNTTTISGNIAGGASGVYKAQTGTLILTGTNTLSNGGWSLYNRGGGTLMFAGDGVTTASGTMGIAGTGGIIVITNNASVTATQLYLGNGGSAWGTVNQYGGTVNFNSADATRVLIIGEYGGATSYYNLYGGTLTVTNPAGSGRTYIGWDGGGQMTIAGGLAVLKQVVADGQGAVLTVSGGELRMGSGGIAWWSGPSFTITLGSATLSSYEAWTSAVGMALNGTNAPTRIDTAGGNIGLSGALSGAGGLAKTGAGTLTLSGANTYAGATAVSNGALVVNGTHTGVGTYTVAAGSRLAGSGTIGETVQAAPGATLENGSNSQFGTLSMSSLQGSNFTLRTLLGATPAFRVTTAGGFLPSGTNTIELYAGVSTTGQYVIVDYAGTLTPEAFASLRLSSTQRRLGGTLVNNTNNTSVDLVVTNVETLKWTGAAGSAWDIGATTNWQYASDAAPAAFMQLDRILFDDTATNFTVTAVEGVTPAAMVVSNGVNAYTIGGGAISGVTAFQKSGTGTVVLAGANTYLGVTTVNGGTLSVGTLANGGTASPIGAAGTGPENLVLSGGTLQYTGPTAGIDRGLTAGAGGATVDVAVAGTTLTTAGVLAGAGGVTKAGAGTLYLNGNNTYTGPTVITGGTLNLNNPSGGAYTYSGGTISINNGSTLRISRTSYDQYWFSGKTFVFDSQGGGTVDTTVGVNFVVYGGSVIRTTGGAENWVTGTSGINLHNWESVTLDVARGNSDSDLTLSCPLGNSGGLIKIGGGVATLGAVNTYTGATLVNAGTLRVNGWASGAVTVATNAVLAGTGGIGGLVTLQGGATVTPGTNSVAALTVGALSVSNNAVYVWEKGPSSADAINVTGTNTLVFAAGATVTLDVRALGGELTPSTDRVLMSYKGTAPATLPAWRIVTTNSPVPVKVTGSVVNRLVGANTYNVVFRLSPSGGAILILR